MLGKLTPIMSNGRDHNFGKWSKETAIRITPASVGDLEAEQLQLEMAITIKPHFEECILCEKNKIASSLVNWEGYDVLSFVEDAIKSIVAKAKEVNDEWLALARQEIGNMMATVIHIERLWYGDDNLDHVAAQNYKKKHIGE